MKRPCLAVLCILIFPVLLAADNFSDSPEQKAARHNMVENQIRRRGVTDRRVLEAMAEIPRHYFVPRRMAGRAYYDHPLPIGLGQTISQPYIVALMTESLKLKGDERVLEIGTGSGYQAAVLARMAREVYTVEIKQQLHERAERLLKALNVKNVETRHGDGYFGWPEAAPFDCIMITAAVDHVPPPLLKQLKDRGRLILPLGNPFSYQNLSLVFKKDDDYTLQQITGVLFVPMTGRALDEGAGPGKIGP